MPFTRTAQALCRPLEQKWHLGHWTLGADSIRRCVSSEVSTSHKLAITAAHFTFEVGSLGAEFCCGLLALIERTMCVLGRQGLVRACSAPQLGLGGLSNPNIRPLARPTPAHCYVLLCSRDMPELRGGEPNSLAHDLCSEQPTEEGEALVHGSAAIGYRHR